MIEKFNKNTKVEQLTNMFLSRGEENALPLKILYLYFPSKIQLS